MKIEIHIRDSERTGKRIGLAGMRVESARVFKESGDGARMDRYCVAFLAVARAAVLEKIRQIKSSAVGCASEKTAGTPSSVDSGNHTIAASESQSRITIS